MAVIKYHTTVYIHLLRFALAYDVAPFNSIRTNQVAALLPEIERQCTVFPRRSCFVPSGPQTLPLILAEDNGSNFSVKTPEACTLYVNKCRLKGQKPANVEETL